MADAAPGPTPAETNSQTTAVLGPVVGGKWDSWDGQLRWTDIGGGIWDMQQQTVVAEKDRVCSWLYAGNWGTAAVWDLRIIEQFGVEGTFKSHPVHPPCNEQVHLQVDQAAQSPTQPCLECFQGWGFYHHSGQTSPVFHHLHGKKGFAYIQSDVSM